MLCKLHETSKGNVLACCDKELIGKTLKDGKLEFTVSKSFYEGKPVTESELAEMMQNNGNINLVGEKVVNIAIKKGLIDKENVIRIQNVPHAAVFKI